MPNAPDAPDDHPVVAAAVIVHRGRVLLARRRISEGDLSWQFPAGKVEPGESRRAAAVREAKEETGLDVRAVRSLGERIHPRTGRLMSYTACEVVGGTAGVADARELSEVAWVTREKIPDLVPYGLFDAVREYLDSALPPGR